jgi:putative transposase
MREDRIASERKSHIELGEIYFWTATIHRWQKLLLQDVYKEVLIRSLVYLSDTGKIDVYAFVIMPTHIHLIWWINAPNGKETSQASFLKYTAHEFRKLAHKEGRLGGYRVDAANKRHEFWKRDSLAVRLYNRKVALQKLKYIHRNPLAAHWQLAKDPCDYQYSSARYYEFNEKKFSFLKDLWEVV